jgi:hypothetical protein
MCLPCFISTGLNLHSIYQQNSRPLPNDDCVVREMQPSDGMSSLIAMLQRVQDCFDQMLWINRVFGIADFLFMHALIQRQLNNQYSYSEWFYYP